MRKAETVLSVLKEIRSLLHNRMPIPMSAGTVKPEVPGAVRFVDNKDGTITDKKTGLMWAKNPHTDLPEKFKSMMAWKDAIAACKELSFAGHKDWRLPTVEELRSIIDYTRGAKENEPAIDTKFFPDTKCSWYWTSTPCAFSVGSAWCVFFGYGSVSDDSEDYNYCVRPVRSSQ
jgi:hypothetical protein